MWCSSKYFLVSFFLLLSFFVCFMFPPLFLLFISCLFCFIWKPFVSFIESLLCLPSCVSPVSPSCALLQCIQILAVPFCLCQNIMCALVSSVPVFASIVFLQSYCICISQAFGKNLMVQFSTLFRYKNMSFFETAPILEVAPTPTVGYLKKTQCLKSNFKFFFGMSILCTCHANENKKYANIQALIKLQLPCSCLLVYEMRLCKQSMPTCHLSMYSKYIWGVETP